MESVDNVDRGQQQRQVKRVEYQKPKSAFDSSWQSARCILEQVAGQVGCFYSNAERERAQTFKLKRSVLPAYHTVYSLCNAKPSYRDVMFEKFKDSLQDYIYRNGATQGKRHIHEFNNLWESFATYMLTISKRVFSYLVKFNIIQDRYFAPALDQGSLSRVGLNLFKNQVLNLQHKAFLFDQYIEELGRMRERKVITHRQLLKFSQSLVVLDQKIIFPQLVVNNPYIQTVFLEKTQLFYNHFYQSNKSLVPFAYLSAVCNLIKFEEMLIKSTICLSIAELDVIHKKFEKVVVGKYTDKLLQSKQGLSKYLKDRNIIALKLIHSLYLQYEGFGKIRNTIYQFTLDEGEELLNNIKARHSIVNEQERYRDIKKSQIVNEVQKNTSAYRIQKLQQFYTRLQSLLTQGFGKEKDIEISFRNGVQKVVGKYQSLIQDFLSYARSILDKGQYDQYKDKIKLLFELLPSKDEFLLLYEVSFQKKILDGSFIYLIEKKFIGEISQICGSQSTNRIDKKIQDYVHSLPTCSQFNSQNPNRIISDTKVLSQQLWERKFDEQITFNISIVEPMLSAWQHFQQFYVNAFEKRKLTILPFQSKLVLHVRFNFIELRVKCNLLQACIIFFVANARREVSEEEVISHLMIQKTILQKFMENIPPFIKERQQTGTYIMDWSFTCKDITLNLDDKATEDKKIPKTVMQDRDLLIEAAIMKSMKKLKQSNFEQVVVQVNTRIKLFKPQPANIKAGIQKLVKKEMLQQSQNGTFKYIQ